MTDRPAADALPLVSVVLPAYKEPLAVLARAMDSILSQTLEALELIVVLDDPGAAGKQTFLESRASLDTRVRVIVNEANLGPWASYERGIAAARAPYVAVQDSDDESLPERLEHQLAYLRDHPQVDVLGTAVAYVSESTGAILMERHYPADARTSVRRFSPVAHCAVMRRRELGPSLGGYDLSPAYRHAADYELWCRWIASGVRIHNLDRVLYRYRQGDANFKALHVRAILRDTVAIKRRYRRTLGFGAVDNLVLAAEILGTGLPANVVLAAFYALNRWRSRNRSASGPS